MDLNVPKGGLWHVSDFMTRRGAAYTAATGLPFPRPIPSLDHFMDTVGQAACARSTRVRVGTPHKQPLLAVAIVGRLHPIASTPCGHHRLEAAPHFPHPWGCLPMRRWKFNPTFHWAPQPRRTGPNTRLPMGDRHGRMRE